MPDCSMEKDLLPIRYRPFAKKVGGQKIDIISLFLNEFSWDLAQFCLLPIQTQAKKFRIF